MPKLSNYFQFGNVDLHLLDEVDIDATGTLINEAYSYQDEAKGRPRINAQELRQRIAQCEFYIAKTDKGVVGCVYVERLPKRLHFGLLAVAGELRGKGLGLALIKAVEDYAHALHMKGVELDYMSIAPWLKPYYENYGFVETGEVTSWGNIELIRMAKNV